MIIDLIVKTIYTTTSLSRYKIYINFYILNYKGKNMISFVSLASIVLSIALIVLVSFRCPPVDELFFIY